MNLLAIDPSSTSTGYAVLDIRGNVIEAGILKPNKTTDHWHARAFAMFAEIPSLISSHHVNVVVIEEPSESPLARRRMSHGVVRACFGMAVYAAAQCVGLDHVKLIPLISWTRGKDKASRAVANTMGLKGYNPEKDKGLDAADAIGLGRWWLNGGQDRIAKITTEKRSRPSRRPARPARLLLPGES